MRKTNWFKYFGIVFTWTGIKYYLELETNFIQGLLVVAIIWLVSQEVQE